MKKSIAALALTMSATNAFALIGPTPGNRPLPVPSPEPTPRTVCLDVNQEEDGSLEAFSCDESARNAMFRRELKANGCAENQVAIKSTTIKVRSCPTMVQL